jgi:hypothetical protein
MVKKKPAPSKIKSLEIKEAKLRRELKDTLKEISEDTKKRGEDDYLGVVERQKLANRSVDIRSKLMRLQDEIGTREVIKEDRSSKEVRNRIRDRYAAAARRHNKLLWATVELERMKEDENAIRAIANDELGLQSRQNEETSPIDDRTVDSRKICSATSRISTSSLRHATDEQDFKALERQNHLEHVRESLSSLGLHSPREQLQKADGLSHKYDLKLEMRNLAHGQMISRQNKNSYWRINPPYRRVRKNVVHVRRSYAKDFYEDKIDIMQARDNSVFTPRKEVLKDMKTKQEDDTGRFTMTSGRTISVKKMKDFTPPGMKLSPLESVAEK